MLVSLTMVSEQLNSDLQNIHSGNRYEMIFHMLVSLTMISEQLHNFHS